MHVKRDFKKIMLIFAKLHKFKRMSTRDNDLATNDFLDCWLGPACENPNLHHLNKEMVGFDFLSLALIFSDAGSLKVRTCLCLFKAAFERCDEKK